MKDLKLTDNRLKQRPIKRDSHNLRTSLIEGNFQVFPRQPPFDEQTFWEFVIAIKLIDCLHHTHRSEARKHQRHQLCKMKLDFC